MTRETELRKEGEQIQEQHLAEHLERKANLAKEIAALTKQLETKQETNRAEEAKLTSQYESADKMYIEMLDTYDVEMQNHQAQLAELGKEYDERAHELHQLQ